MWGRRSEILSAVFCLIFIGSVDALRTHSCSQQQRVLLQKLSAAPSKLKVIGRAGPPPTECPPSYEETDREFLDKTLLGLFRSRLKEEIGYDSPKPGYKGLMEMVLLMNSPQWGTAEECQAAARRTLKALFPSWLPGAFAVMFSRPFPVFSSLLNAWVTQIAGRWLMGECELNDVEIDGGQVGVRHGLLVKRCRFLEESGCASVCINACKLPTEFFFMADMGLPVTLEPNYDDFSCQFSFGKTPPPREEEEVFNVTCFEQCPSRRTVSSRTKCGGLTSS